MITSLCHIVSVTYLLEGSVHGANALQCSVCLEPKEAVCDSCLVGNTQEEEPPFGPMHHLWQSTSSAHLQAAVHGHYSACMTGRLGTCAASQRQARNKQLETLQSKAELNG